MLKFCLTAAVIMSACSLAALAQDKDVTQKEIERYRQLLAEGNPAELFEARGEEL